MCNQILDIANKEYWRGYREGMEVILDKYSELEKQSEQKSIDKSNTSDHWQHLREMAAIAAMQGVMNFFGSLDYDRETIAELAVKQADALVKELKGEKL